MFWGFTPLQSAAVTSHNVTIYLSSQNLSFATNDFNTQVKYYIWSQNPQLSTSNQHQNIQYKLNSLSLINLSQNNLNSFYYYNLESLQVSLYQSSLKGIQIPSQSIAFSLGNITSFDRSTTVGTQILNSYLFSPYENIQYNLENQPAIQSVVNTSLPTRDFYITLPHIDLSIPVNPFIEKITEGLDNLSFGTTQGLIEPLINALVNTVNIESITGSYSNTLDYLINKQDISVLYNISNNQDNVSYSLETKSINSFINDLHIIRNISLNSQLLSVTTNNTLEKITEGLDNFSFGFTQGVPSVLSQSYITNIKTDSIIGYPLQNIDYISNNQIINIIYGVLGQSDNQKLLSSQSISSVIRVLTIDRVVFISTQNLSISVNPNIEKITEGLDNLSFGFTQGQVNNQFQLTLQSIAFSSNQNTQFDSIYFTNSLDFQELTSKISNIKLTSDKDISQQIISSFVNPITIPLTIGVKLSKIDSYISIAPFVEQIYENINTTSPSLFAQGTIKYQVNLIPQPIPIVAFNQSVISLQYSKLLYAQQIIFNQTPYIFQNISESLSTENVLLTQNSELRFIIRKLLDSSLNLAIEQNFNSINYDYNISSNVITIPITSLLPSFDANLPVLNELISNCSDIKSNPSYQLNGFDLSMYQSSYLTQYQLQLFSSDQIVSNQNDIINEINYIINKIDTKLYIEELLDHYSYIYGLDLGLVNGEVESYLMLPYKIKYGSFVVVPAINGIVPNTSKINKITYPQMKKAI